ncbi:hypothetical protein P167DRAFT_112382 [Morchella conica CCBAS932]|uniref:Uncharacterized protein n=1 Tax=Morchella conica CCBAS932 TaxID=1392247 RepID=A0A3N4KS60_9PEZI|nr:hypothetical protein P167DRAFT_112382 [Morchella conica CCBAS932]
MPIANIVRSERIVATRCAPINRQFSGSRFGVMGLIGLGLNGWLRTESILPACPSVTVQHLFTKVDDGFKRIDGWMKVGLGLFVGTILVKLAYLDENMKQEMKSMVKGEVKLVRGELRSEMSALKIDIVLELHKMESRMEAKRRWW